MNAGRSKRLEGYGSEGTAAPLRAPLLLLALVLAGCGPMYPEDALQAREMAEVYLEGTRRAEVERAFGTEAAWASTRQASEAELALLRARQEATMEAWRAARDWGEATRQAGEATAGAAATAVELRGRAALTAEAATRTAPAVRATETVLALNLTRREGETRRGETLDELWANVLPMGVMVGVFALLAIGIRFLWKLVDAWLEWKNRRHSLFSAGEGTVVFDPVGEDEPAFRLIGQEGGNFGPSQRRMLMAPAKLDTDPVVKVTASGSVLMSPPAPRLQVDESLTVFMSRAMRVVGPGSNVIPGWRDLGYSGGGTWSAVVERLEEAGLATKSGMGWVLTRRYESLFELNSAIRTGREIVPREQNTVNMD